MGKEPREQQTDAFYKTQFLVLKTFFSNVEYTFF